MRRPLTSLFLALGLVALASAAAARPAAGAAFWSLPEGIVRGFPGITTYDVAVDTGGVVHVVFSQGDGNIYYLNNSGGTWKQPAATAFTQIDYAVQNVHLLATDDGQLHLFWIEAKGANCQVRHMRDKSLPGSVETMATYTSLVNSLGVWVDAQAKLHYLVQGSVIGAVDYRGDFGYWEQLNIGAYNANRAYAVDELGVHHSVKPQANGGKTDIIYANDLSGSWVEVKLATVDAATLPKLLVDKDRHVHVAWSDSVPAGGHILHTSDAADGATFPSSAQDITAGSDLGFSGDFSMVSDDAGNVTLVTTGYAAPAALFAITDETGRWASPQRMNAEYGGAHPPALASRYLGTYVVYDWPEGEGLGFLFGPPAGSTAPARVTGGHCVIGAAQASNTWYFAEGYTGTGFNSWLTLANATDTTGTATVTYMLEGEVRQAYYPVRAHARTTIDLVREIGPAKNVSIRVESPMAITVERPMYFAYPAAGGEKWDGGHCVMGVNQAAKEWYFAEGTTRTGFDEWLTIQNPDPVQQAEITCEYMRAAGGSIIKTYWVPPATRGTVNVNEEVPNSDVSMHLTSTVDIICERPMYFSYGGGWTGGHCVAGATAPRNDWYFAEGTTRDGFDEWLCIQNPTNVAANVSFSFMLDGGRVVPASLNVPAHTRGTLHVPEIVEPGRDVSVAVSCPTTPIVVERPMYFALPAGGGEGPWTGGHDVLGGVPGKSFFFAEGCTRAGFREYLCLQNPGDGIATVMVQFIPAGGTVTNSTFQVGAHARLTIDVNFFAGADKDVSMQVTSAQDIIAERPMYFSYNLQ